MSETNHALGDDWVVSMPLIFSRVQRVINDPESSFKEIAEIISGDSGLVSRLLRIVNSPFYGFSSKIETITHALNIVGMEQLNQLVLATSAVSAFEGIPKDLVQMDSFWRHSIACGLAARAIAKKREWPDVERFYVMGMLHDVGSLVIYKKMPKRAREILLRSKTEGLPLFEVERQVLGFDHAQVGGALLKEWNLSESLVEAVAFHHDPSQAALFPVEAAILHVADIVAYDLKLGSSGQPGTPPLDSEFLAVAELFESDLAVIKKMVGDQFQDMIAMFLSK